MSLDGSDRRDAAPTEPTLDRIGFLAQYGVGKKNKRFYGHGMQLSIHTRQVNSPAGSCSRFDLE